MRAYMVVTDPENCRITEPGPLHGVKTAYWTKAGVTCFIFEGDGIYDGMIEAPPGQTGVDIFGNFYTVDLYGEAHKLPFSLPDRDTIPLVELHRPAVDSQMGELPVGDNTEEKTVHNA